MSTFIIMTIIWWILNEAVWADGPTQQMSSGLVDLQRPVEPLPLTFHWTDTAPAVVAVEVREGGQVGAELHRDAARSCPASTYAGSWCLFGCSCPRSPPRPWSLALGLRELQAGKLVCGPPASVCWTARGPACPGWDLQKGETAPSCSPRVEEKRNVLLNK